MIFQFYQTQTASWVGLDLRETETEDRTPFPPPPPPKETEGFRLLSVASGFPHVCTHNLFTAFRNKLSEKF